MLMVHYGGAGHSKEILKRLSKNGLLVGIDRDQEALNAAKINLAGFENVKFVHGNHDDIKEIIHSLGIQKVDGILLDLGVSSYQLDEKNRGFSYLGSNELDMRMDKSQNLTAKDIVNTYSEEKLADIIYKYGEEKFSRIIAKNICLYRENNLIKSTDELVSIIENSIPKSKQKNGHPAKKTFQAIRIAVNNELEPLYNTILDCIDILANEGRLCVLTFHSLEDRFTKDAFVKAQGQCTCPKDLPYCICNYESSGVIITKKPIEASESEKNENSRSKSAKLRVFEKHLKYE